MPTKYWIAHPFFVRLTDAHASLPPNLFQAPSMVARAEANGWRSKNNLIFRSLNSNQPLLSLRVAIFRARFDLRENFSN